MDVAKSNHSSDVSGLATAFINQGVAAYVAPLWPVDDEIARWMAIEFYGQLLRERYSVGEALRRARMSIWNDLRSSECVYTMPAKTALTWSSFVLYGDPTARLLQSLWTPAHGSQVRRRFDRTHTHKVSGVTSARGLRSTTSEQIGACVQFPEGLVTVVDQRQSSSAPATGLRIELVERFGIRFWRCLSSLDATTGRTFSYLGEVLEDPDVHGGSAQARQVIRSLVGTDRVDLDARHVLKAWTIKNVDIAEGHDKQSMTTLAVEFDKLPQPSEHLTRYVAVDDIRQLRLDEKGKEIDEFAKNGRSAGQNEWLSRPNFAGQFDRTILFIHGICSNCDSIFHDLSQRADDRGPAEDQEAELALNWMLRRYRAVLGYDHFTLSKTPADNARDLLSQLEILWDQSNRRTSNFDLDIVCHGRGGLVARSLVGLLKSMKSPVSVRRIVFVGVPQQGITAAQSADWGWMADVLVNLIADDATGVYGRLSGYLIYLLAHKLDQNVSSYLGLDPETIAESPTRWAGYPECYFVAANYAPQSDRPNLMSIMPQLSNCSRATTAPALFSVPNDLLVETASMWALEGGADWSRDVPPSLADRVLLFDTRQDGPSKLVPVVKTGIHHENYFSFSEVRHFLREKLDVRE